MPEREVSPMKGQFPDPKKIVCKDCFLRDKTAIVLKGKRIEVGVTKSFCDAFPAPPDSNGKPSDILFRNARCPYYVSEKAVT